MTIERVGPLDPIQNLKKSGKSRRPDNKNVADSISLSPEAKSKSEIYNAIEIARSTPDIRLDRVEEVKRKLQDPNYITEKVVDELADRLMELFDISG